MNSKYFFLSFFLLFLSILNAQSPILIKDLNQSGASNAQCFVEFKGALYYIANDEKNDVWLYKTYGESSDNQKVLQIPKESGVELERSNVYLMASNDKYIYFNISLITLGWRGWIIKTDGESLLSYVELPDYSAVDVGNNIILNDKLIFRNNIRFPLNSYQLWETDATNSHNIILHSDTLPIKNLFLLDKQIWFNKENGGLLKIEANTAKLVAKNQIIAFAQGKSAWGYKENSDTTLLLQQFNSFVKVTDSIVIDKFKKPIWILHQKDDTTSIGIIYKDNALNLYQFSNTTTTFIKQIKKKDLVSHEILSTQIMPNNTVIFGVRGDSGWEIEYWSINVDNLKLDSIGSFKAIYEAYFTDKNNFFHIKLEFVDNDYYPSIFSHDVKLNKTTKLETFKEITANKLYKNKMYLSATQSLFKDTGNELWVSDLVKKETKVYVKLNTGNNGSRPYYFYKLNDKRLFFNASIEGNEGALFTTDATTNGTKLLINNPKTTLFSPEIIGRIGTKVIVQAEEKQREMICSIDENLKIDTLLKDGRSAFPVELNGKLYFIVFSYTTWFSKPCHLWETDGTKKGTKKIRTFNDISAGDIYLQVVNQKLYYVYRYKDTMEEVDLNNGNIKNSFTIPQLILPIVKYKGENYVLGTDNVNVGLYKLDVDNQKYELIRQFTKPEDIYDIHSSSLYANDKFLFIQHNIVIQSPGAFTWISDGTKSGTKKLMEESANILSIKNNYAPNLLFLLVKPNITTTQLWSTDGTPEGTTYLTNDYHTIYEADVSNRDSSWYFLAPKNYNDIEFHIFKIDKNGKKIDVVLNSKKVNWDLSSVWQMAIINDALVFGYNDRKIGNELYKIPLSNLVATRNFSANVEKLITYPNPIDNEIYIENPTDNPVLLTVYDMLGQTIQHNLIYEKSNIVNTNNLKSGIYIFEINCKNKIYQSKIIKN
jgi:hypothetical protein